MRFSATQRRTREYLASRLYRIPAAVMYVVLGVIKVFALISGDVRHVKPFVFAQLGGGAWLSFFGAFEVVIGCGLLIGNKEMWAWLAFLFASAIATGLIVTMNSGSPISGCGCFGVLDLPLVAHVGVVGALLTASWYSLSSGQCRHGQAVPR